MATENCGTLFDTHTAPEGIEPDGRTQINRTLYYVDRGGSRVVFRLGEPLYRFALSDTLSERFVAVHMRLGGLATQGEVAKAFGHSEATQRRWEKRYQERGMEGLEKGRSTGRPRGVPATCDLLLRTWFSQGVTNTEMARRLGVSPPAIHRALARLGLRKRTSCSPELPWRDDVPEPPQASDDHESGGPPECATDEGSQLGTDTTQDEGDVLAGHEDTHGEVTMSAEAQSNDALECGNQSEPPVQPDNTGNQIEIKTERLEDVIAQMEEEGFTLDQDPDDRTGDRTLARLGLLDDALPLFKDRPCLARGGVLLAIPLLAQSGLLEVFSKVYCSLGSAFYGLRTTVVVLFLTALLRIKRPEHFKEYNPRELGHVMGLDRAPEVKTVRRKLTELAARRQGRQLMHAFAEHRIDEDPDRVAFLYIDGHVREYYGRHKLGKAKKSQSQVAKPAATDNWVHDTFGEPLLLVTSEMNEGLTKVLEPILDEVKELVGDREPTVIFDRGGFSAKLFARLRSRGFHVMTYRKGKTTPWPVSGFAPVEYEVDGRTYHYTLAERKRVRVGRVRAKRKKESRKLGPQYLWMREVRVLRKDGRQTSILVSRNDLSTVEVPYRQFNRWRQENYFKYMDAEYELDGLVEYQVQDVAEDKDRPNPERRPVERALDAAKTRVQQLRAELGKQVHTKDTSRQHTIRGFKIAHAKLRAELTKAEGHVERLKEQLDALPKRVSANDLKTLTTEKKLIVDTIKMAAYQVETRLLKMLSKHYCRTDDEGRTLLQAAFQSTARLEVRNDELLVELAPQSSPHRTEAVRKLCDDLNTIGAKFPGTRLRLRLAVGAHEPLTNARGSCQEF